jgi:hypothetical protein
MRPQRLLNHRRTQVHGIRSRPPRSLLARRPRSCRRPAAAVTRQRGQTPASPMPLSASADGVGALPPSRDHSACRHTRRCRCGRSPSPRCRRCSRCRSPSFPIGKRQRAGPAGPACRFLLASRRRGSQQLGGQSGCSWPRADGVVLDVEDAVAVGVVPLRLPSPRCSGLLAGIVGRRQLAGGSGTTCSPGRGRSQYAPESSTAISTRGSPAVLAHARSYVSAPIPKPPRPSIQLAWSWTWRKAP